MEKFVDLLLKTSGMPDQRQQLAAELFPRLVAMSKMKLWHTGDPVSNVGSRILIGIAASYSIPDLQLLDEINKRLSGASNMSDQVDVFDVSGCKEMKDFENYIPGIGNVYATPIIGYWENGVLKESLSGFHARNWLVNRYQLSSII
jgi:hypothetical protein